jgi:serine acetyltransferase
VVVKSVPQCVTVGGIPAVIIRSGRTALSCVTRKHGI